VQSAGRTLSCHSEHSEGVSKNPFSPGDADPSTALRLLRMTIRSTGRTSACHSEHPEGVSKNPSLFRFGGCGSFDCAALAQDDSTKYGTPEERTVREAGPYIAWFEIWGCGSFDAPLGRSG